MHTTIRLNNWIKGFLIVYYSVFSINAFTQEKKELIIVTFGNSTTAPRNNIQKVYAERVHDTLLTLGINNKVINSGIGGSHTGSIKDNDYAKVEHAMDRFDKSVMAYHPSWVTLNFGLNDAWQDKGEDGPSRIPINQFEKNMSYFIDKIKAQNGRVIILTPNPIGKKFERWRYEKVKAYKKVIKKLARKNNIYRIDTWKLFYTFVRNKQDGIDFLLPDGIHPNDAGHELIAAAITKIIFRAENNK